MASGVKVSDECVKAYDALKKDKKHRYILFKFNDTWDEVVLDYVSERSETFADFEERMLSISRQGQGRYAFYDFPVPGFADVKQRETGKILGVTWSDDDKLKTKVKMLHSTTSNAVKAACVGWTKFIQVNGPDELTEELLSAAAGIKKVV